MEELDDIRHIIRLMRDQLEESVEKSEGLLTQDILDKSKELDSYIMQYMKT